MAKSRIELHDAIFPCRLAASSLYLQGVEVSRLSSGSTKTGLGALFRHSSKLVGSPTLGGRFPLTWLPWLVLVLGLGITTALWLHARDELANQSEQEFQFMMNKIRYGIEYRLKSHVQVLRGVIGLFDASDSVTRQEFHSYIEALHLEDRFPGIQGVGFSQLVPRSHKARHIEEIRRQGFPDYEIRPAGERELYTSIIYLEPFAKRNLRAFGYDMCSEPVRRLAMERARDTGWAAMTGKVTLVQETDTDIQPGFLLYVPVYLHELPHDSLETRRANLQGWAYSPLRMHDMMRSLLESLQLTDLLALVDLEIYDGEESSAATLMFDTRPNPWPAATTPLFQSLLPIEFGGHEWTLRLSSTPGFETRLSSEKTTSIALAGSLISLVLTLLLRVLASTQVQITAALKETERMNEQLLASEERSRAFFDNAASLVWVKDLQGRFLVVNDYTERLLGLGRPQILGRKVEELRPGAESETHRDNDRQVIEQGLPMEFEETTRLGDGLHTYISVKFPLRNAQGHIIALGAICTDITGHKQTEEALRTSLEEKTVLLKEVHHRVKNNLQIISSLLNLQLDRQPLPEVANTLRDTQNRIRSMALLHENLYRSGNLAHIRLDEYVESLSASLRRMAGAEATRIRVEPRIEDLSLPLDQAVPCGLIINELISNALKHAFPSGRPGRVLIEAQARNQSWIWLRVADDGLGLPSDLHPDQTDTLGLQLVSMLTEQLQGSLEISRHEGTAFEIIFPVKGGVKRPGHER